MGIIPEDAMDTWVEGGGEDKPLDNPQTDTPAETATNPDEPAEEKDKATFDPEPTDEPEPKKDPEPKEEADPKAEPEDEPESDIMAALTETLAKIDSKIESIKEAEPTAPAAEPEPTERPVNPALQELLEHEDALVRETAEKVVQANNELEDRIAALENAGREREFQVVAEQVQNEINGVSKDYGLSKAEVDAVTDYMTVERPALASTVTFEEGMLMKFPGRAKVAENPTGEPRTVVKVPDKSPEVSTVVDRAGNAGASPKASKAPKHENMEQAIARGFEALTGS